MVGFSLVCIPCYAYVQAFFCKLMHGKKNHALAMGRLACCLFVTMLCTCRAKSCMRLAQMRSVLRDVVSFADMFT